VVSRLTGLVATYEPGSPVIDALVTVTGSTQATRTTVRDSFFLDG
jgi:hypothetical protein